MSGDLALCWKCGVNRPRSPASKICKFCAKLGKKAPLLCGPNPLEPSIHGRKVCGSCLVEKDCDGFHKREASKDGLSALCKECQQAYDISRRDDVSRSEYRSSTRGRYSDKRTEYNRKWRSENPEKYAAHTALNNAIRDGKISKGLCQSCGSGDVEAHHDDYSKPLDVVWLCTEHHGLTRRIEIPPETISTV